MNRRTKIFGAVIAALSLTVPLTACTKYEPAPPPDTAESAPAEEVVEEEVVEEEVPEDASDVSAGDAALWYVNAARGDTKAWEDYDAGDPPEDAVEYEKEITEGALEMMMDEPLPQKELDEIYAALDEAYSRIEIEVEEEDVAEDVGTVTLAVWGVNQERGSELAGESDEGVEMFLDSDSDMDDLFAFVMLKTWELAPLADEPILIDIPMVRNEDGRWIPDTAEFYGLNSLLQSAFKDEKASVKMLLEMMDD